jgi:hypothetical protein
VNEPALEEALEYSGQMMVHTERLMRKTATLCGEVSQFTFGFPCVSVRRKTTRYIEPLLEKAFGPVGEKRDAVWQVRICKLRFCLQMSCGNFDFDVWTHATGDLCVGPFRARRILQTRGTKA